MTVSPAIVSAVIPTYNRPDLLRIALKSVVEQSYRHLEIIVQDNASESDPTEIIAAFGDPRITLYRNAVNIGMTGNFLAGIERASGKYIALLSDDDVWRPDYLATLVPRLEADDDLILAFCDHDIIDDHGRIDEAETEKITRRWGRHLLHEGIYRPFDDIALVQRSICVASAAVLRRGAIDFTAIPAEIGSTLDLYVAYLAARTGRGCYYEPRRLVQYRCHSGSTTSQSKQTERRIELAHNAVFYWNRFFEDPALGRNRQYFQMKRGFNALIVVLGLLRKGDWGAAMSDLRDFLARGYIQPGILLGYLKYARHLHRTTA